MNIDIHKYRKDMRALVDWFQFTLPVPSAISPTSSDLDIFYVFDVLGIPITEFKSCKRGSNGYNQRLRWNQITVCFDGTKEMGINISMSGQGCRAYEEYMVLKFSKGEIEPHNIWAGLIDRIRKYSNTFSRIDIAVDDTKTYFDLEDIAYKLSKGECSSLFTDYRVITSGKISTGVSNGLTIYIGSATSDMQIVMYDKMKEMIKKGRELDENIQAWNRHECRFYDDHASQIAALISAGQPLGIIVHSTIHKYFNVLQPSATDKKKSRWKAWHKWRRFLGDVEKAELKFVKREKSLDDLITWATKSLSKVNAKLEALGVLDEITAAGVAKLTEDDLNQFEMREMTIRSFNENRGNLDQDTAEYLCEMTRLEMTKIEKERLLRQKKNQPENRIDQETTLIG